MREMNTYPNIFVNENSIIAKYKKHEDGKVSWHIPGYDIYFSSPDFNAGKKKINSLIKMYDKYAREYKLN